LRACTLCYTIFILLCCVIVLHCISPLTIVLCMGLVTQLSSNNYITQLLTVLTVTTCVRPVNYSWPRTFQLSKRCRAQSIRGFVDSALHSASSGYCVTERHLFGCVFPQSLKYDHVYLSLVTAHFSSELNCDLDLWSVDVRMSWWGQPLTWLTNDIFLQCCEWHCYWLGHLTRKIVADEVCRVGRSTLLYLIWRQDWYASSSHVTLAIISSVLTYLELVILAYSCHGQAPDGQRRRDRLQCVMRPPAFERNTCCGWNADNNDMQ